MPYPLLLRLRGSGLRQRHYRSADFFDLPPSFPFALDAVFFASLLDWPPSRPNLDAIHALEQRKPSKRAGT